MSDQRRTGHAGGNRRHLRSTRDGGERGSSSSEEESPPRRVQPTHRNVSRERQRSYQSQSSSLPLRSRDDRRSSQVESSSLPIRNRDPGGPRDSAPRSNTRDPRIDRYQFGRIIEIPWPPGSATDSRRTDVTPLDSSETGRKRRFVIVQNRVDARAFVAVAIKTYNYEGVGSAGVIKRHHCIVYVGRHAPQPDPTELPTRSGELGMQPNPIRVEPFILTESLSRWSRLDLAEHHTFSWNRSDIALFGKVHQNSEEAFASQFTYVRDMQLQRDRGGASETDTSTDRSTLGSDSQATVRYARYGGRSVDGSEARTIVPQPAQPTYDLNSPPGELINRQATLSIAEISYVLRWHRAYALHHGLTPPAAITEDTLQTLALDYRVRRDHVQSIIRDLASQREQQQARQYAHQQAQQRAQQQAHQQAQQRAQQQVQQQAYQQRAQQGAQQRLRQEAQLRAQQRARLERQQEQDEDDEEDDEEDEEEEEEEDEDDEDEEQQNARLRQQARIRQLIREGRLRPQG